MGDVLMSIWGQLETSFQLISGDYSAATLVQAKQDMNVANKIFNAAINNYFTRRSKSTDLVQNQQEYQMPPDAIRAIGVDFLQSDGRRIPLTQVRSEYQWRQLNRTVTSSSYLVYWFQKGADEFSVYPAPSADVSSGLILVYEPKGATMSQADYSTGTVTLTQDSTTLTGLGTAFTSNMVGREFKVTDGSDGYDYRVASYTSGTVLSLEEPFMGISGASKTFLIVEAPVYPSEYHTAPLDYALGNFFLMNNNPVRAAVHRSGDYKRPGLFESAVLDAKEQYASSSSSNVITDDVPFFDQWRDNTQTIGE